MPECRGLGRGREQAREMQVGAGISPYQCSKGGDTEQRRDGSAGEHACRCVWVFCTEFPGTGTPCVLQGQQSERRAGGAGVMGRGRASCQRLRFCSR